MRYLSHGEPAMRVRQEARLRAGFSLALGAVGTGAAIVSITMGNPLQHPIGPGYVPFGVSVCLAVLALREAAVALRGSGDGGAPEGEAGPPAAASPSAGEAGASGGSGLPRQAAGRLRWLQVAAWLALSIGAWRAGGYLVGMTLGVLGSMRIDHRVRLRLGLPFAVLLAVCLWLLFEVGLKTDLG